MSDRILVFVSWLVGLGIVVILGGVIVLGVMAATGNFGKSNECVSAAGAPPRGVVSDGGVADQWDAKWKAFDAQLDGGQTAAVTFTESEVTSRAQEFLDRKGAPIDEVIICFHDGSAEARGKVEIPALGDVPGIGSALKTNVKMTGTIELDGPHPVVTITDLEAGNLPGFATDQVEDSVADIINSRLDDLNRQHILRVTFTEGSVEVSGQP